MIGDSSEQVASLAHQSRDSFVYLTGNLSKQSDLLASVNGRMGDVDTCSAHASEKAGEASSITIQAREMAEAGNEK
ncbi:MAG: hypothetical protein R2874_10525 [Desulfobacterales bacterium]